MLMSFLPKSNELAEISIRFHESARAFGVPIRIKAVKDYKEPELGYHPDIEYHKRSYNTFMMLDQSPTPTLLKKLGWAVDADSDTKPMLFYIARFFPTRENRPHKVNSNTKELLLNKYSIITIDHDYDELAGRKFVVSKMKSQSFNPVYYIGLLVPYRATRVRDPDPDLDGNIEELDALEFDGNLRYLSKEKGRDLYREDREY